MTGYAPRKHLTSLRQPILRPKVFIFGLALVIAAGGISTPSLAVDDVEGLSGEVNIGGSLATGNTDTARVDAEIKARFKAGRLEDNYRLVGEFSDDNGTTTAQRILG